MSTATSDRVLVAGAGDMAREHVKTLLHLGIEAERIHVVGFRESNARKLGDDFGVAWTSGGTPALADVPAPSAAIVATSLLALPEVTCALLNYDGIRILVEKPGGLYLRDLVRIRDEANHLGAEVFIAYNRRFYPSVDRVRQICEEDGGVLSCFFDFTEVEAPILQAMRDKDYPREVVDRWGIVDCLHVIDLFLHLAGKPTDWSYQVAGEGSLDWHPSGSIYAGAGVTDRCAVFSYLSTWSGAGRWGVEVTTLRRKLFLRPLEGLRVQERGTFVEVQQEIAAEPARLKAGFCGQIDAFLQVGSGVHGSVLCGVDEAVANFLVAAEILGYPP